jgi:predicted Na+-dependent transporter
LHLWLLLALQAVWIVAWGAARLCGYPVLAEAVYYCGAAPIASAAPIIVHLLRGNVGFITTAMVLSQVVFAVLTPFVLPFIVNSDSLSYTELMLMVAQ